MKKGFSLLFNTINFIAEYCQCLSGRDGTQKDFFVLHYANITKYSVSLLSTYKKLKRSFPGWWKTSWTTSAPLDVWQLDLESGERQMWTLTSPPMCPWFCTGESYPHHSRVKDLISLSWQDILPHRATSPALLVTFHIYCCYFWAALVCTGNHEAEWIFCISILYNFSLPPIVWAPRRLWTNSPKTLTGFYFLPLPRRFHKHILSSIQPALELNLWKGGDGKAGWDCSIWVWSSVNKPNQQVTVKVVFLWNSNCSLSISYCLCSVDKLYSEYLWVHLYFKGWLAAYRGLC